MPNNYPTDKRMVRRFYECSICKREHGTYIQISNLGGNSGLSKFTDFHICDNGKVYVNLYMDSNYRIRSVENLSLDRSLTPSGSKSTLSVPSVGLRRVHLNSIPGFRSIELMITNTKMRYEIKIGSVEDIGAIHLYSRDKIVNCKISGNSDV